MPFWQFFRMGWDGCALLVQPSRIPCKNPTQNKKSADFGSTRSDFWGFNHNILIVPAHTAAFKYRLKNCLKWKKLFKMGPNMTLLTVQTVCYSLVCQKFKMPHISTLPSCTFFKVKIENYNVFVEMSCNYQSVHNIFSRIFPCYF